MVLLLDGCSALGDAYAPMMQALLTFGAFTLMRPSELVALDWEDVDLCVGANGRARVQRRFYRGRTDLPKSNKERTITLVPSARDALNSLLRLEGYYPHGLVFRNKTGGELTAPTLTAYWKEVRARSRIDRDFYTCTKHYGIWYIKVRLGLPGRGDRGAGRLVGAVGYEDGRDLRPRGRRAAPTRDRPGVERGAERDANPS